MSDTSALMDQALHDPVPAIAAADAVLADPPNDVGAVVALRARGLARRQLGEFTESEADLRSALAAAQALDDPNLAAGVGLTLGGTLVFLGRVEDAIELVTECVETSDGEVHAEAIYQLGTTHAQAGDLDTAIALYARAQPLLEAAGRTDWIANLLANRGTMQLHRGNYDAALADLDRAITMCRELGVGPSQLGLYLQNKAYCLQLRGDIAASIDLYGEVDAFLSEHDLPTAVMFSHRCNAYLSAGMYEDALALAQEAHRFHRGGEAVVGAIEALLPGAEAALALDNADLAIHLATAAIDLDTEGAFPVWAARARLVQLEARLRAATTTPADATLAREVHDVAVGSDGVTAARALVLGAEVALATGDDAAAAELLGQVEPHLTAATHAVRMEHATVAARHAAAVDDPPAVLSLVDDGLALFDDLVTDVGHYDVRYKATRHANRLVELALPQLFSARRLDEVISLVERVRAGSLQLGHSPRPAGIGSVAEDETCLLYCTVGDALMRITRTAAGVEHHVLDAAEVGRLVEAHAFDHRQLAHRRNLGAETVEELNTRAQNTDDTLAELLLPRDLSSRVIINPAPVVSDLLWAALPGLVDRAHTVAPAYSFASQTQPELRPRPERAVVLGAAELEHVAPEVEAVASIWGTEARIDPPASAAAELAGVDVLHAAGHFVNDSADPLFSAVPMGELRLRGHEYLQLDPPPKLTVLSACASGRGETVAGAQVGFATAALAAGTATVIVTHTVVEDSATIAAAMTRLHELLRAGESPAEALRIIRSEAAPADRSTVAAIGVVGAGW